MYLLNVPIPFAPSLSLTGCAIKSMGRCESLLTGIPCSSFYLFLLHRNQSDLSKKHTPSMLATPQRLLLALSIKSEACYPAPPSWAACSHPLPGSCAPASQDFVLLLSLRCSFHLHLSTCCCLLLERSLAPSSTDQCLLIHHSAHWSSSPGEPSLGRRRDQIPCRRLSEPLALSLIPLSLRTTSFSGLTFPCWTEAPSGQDHITLAQLCVLCT